MGEWEDFIEKLLERIHQIQQSGKKTDLTILFGRVDKETGKRRPPLVHINERGL